ncbi:carboxypeptidase regulatory-like domain-containing protein [Dyadobacter sp. CY326]|uniref:carboxypeptidase regulatory-like domain-containing protein n=1 Tax=Dyadobacter sp. CY326 TaxID=2907300 RepID=UPI001F17BB80|nr:carboxypeptidase regulatory-like domain-containing protein [Dyadobacter sp. CY326]MCE7065091.1 carboxypeptidase regulatory-like domain-containing protein [Dyadobacter sp. CY326]
MAAKTFFPYFLSHSKTCISFILLTLMVACTEETFIEPTRYGTIKGRVLALKDKSVVKNVLIRINPSGKTVQPDDSGSFEVPQLPTGSYSVQVSADLYKTDVTSVEVLEAQSTNMAVFLTLDTDQNKSPLIPTFVKPLDKSTGILNSTTLSWKSSDPEKDSLSYSVILFKEGQDTSVPIATGLRYDTLAVTNLDYESTYYWQVIASDSINDPVYSEVWSFQTRKIPDLPYVFSRKVNQLYQIFATDGKELLQITHTSSNWRPMVSPNRKRLAFISNSNSDPHIYVSDLIGHNPQRVTVVPVGGVSLTELSFCWSPDGTEILYPNYDKLYAVYPDGTGLRIIAKAPAGRFFAGVDWTAQGNLIIARLTGGSVYENFIYLIKAETGELSELITNKPGKIGNPSFSVDGKNAAFTIDVSNFQNNEGRQLNSRIFLVKIATGELTDLSTGKADGTNDLDPRFSPNGAKIIFTNTSNDGFSPKNIYTNSTSGLDRFELLKDGELAYWR